MTRLITFATDNMSIAAQICKESALQNNVDEVKVYGPGDIDKEFFEANREILEQPRGYGYWLWKPYFIDRELKGMKDGDYLIYSDAGVELVNNINYIVDSIPQHIFLFGNSWKHTNWCKADAFVPLLGEGFYSSDRKQAQASVIAILNGRESRKFVAEWLELCLIPGLIDDSVSMRPNHPEFQEHRHDQAILTSLAIQKGLQFHWWPAMYNAGNFTYDKTGYTDNYPVLFHHHRLRDEDFSKSDDLSRHMQNYFKRKYRLAA